MALSTSSSSSSSSHNPDQQKQQQAATTTATATMPVCNNNMTCQCCKHPIKFRDCNSFIADQLGLWDCEAGVGGGDVFDMVKRIRQQQDDSARVDPKTAEQTVMKAQHFLKQLKRDLAEQGVLHNSSQKYTGKSDEARIMAPFDKDEVVLGHRLGSGGFSTVYEVQGFDLKDDEPSSAPLHPWEKAAREFLSNHAQRETVKSAKKSEFARTSRYALKHMRHSLAEDNNKFEKAAIDLALEAQLMLAMDHPNICKLRGWAKDGVEAYNSGSASDYFMILDLLPETMDDKIFQWRHKFRKYKSRSSMMPWQRAKFAKKLQGLLKERLEAATGIASAMEYMHDKRVINRDIKTANIGFDFHGQVQLFDLGLARLLPSEDASLHDGYVMSRVGTKATMAPEVREKKPYNLSADVYSFGVVLWEIMSLSTCSEYFRRNEAARAQLKDTDSLPLPICCCWPEAIKDLLRRCLATDAKLRPTMAEVRTTLQEQLDELCIEATLSNQPSSKSLAPKQPRPRRRSTFRLDLSRFAEAGSGFLGSNNNNNSGSCGDTTKNSSTFKDGTSVDLGGVSSFSTSGRQRRSTNTSRIEAQ